MRTTFVLDPAVERTIGFRRSVRCAVALEDIGRRERLDAGAINCHVPEIRSAAEPGIAPCLALGRETSRGVPVDMHRRRAHADSHADGEMARRGDALPRARVDRLFDRTNSRSRTRGARPRLVGGSARLVPNAWFAADARGACAPATGCARARRRWSRSRHIRTSRAGFASSWPKARSRDRRFAGAGTPNGAFRFTGLTAADGYRQWALAGASHHSCRRYGAAR